MKQEIRGKTPEFPARRQKPPVFYHFYDGLRKIGGLFRESLDINPAN